MSDFDDFESDWGLTDEDSFVPELDETEWERRAA